MMLKFYRYLISDEQLMCQSCEYPYVTDDGKYVFVKYRLLERANGECLWRLDGRTLRGLGDVEIVENTKETPSRTSYEKYVYFYQIFD